MESKYALKGLALSDPWYDAAWKAAYERTHDDPNLCIIPDIESGYPITMTIAERQKLLDLWESFKPKINHKSKGTIMIFGTGGNMDNKGFDEMWREMKD